MIVDVITYVLIGVGCFFNLIAAWGLHRFPDVYTRLHAGTKCTTFVTGKFFQELYLRDLIKYGKLNLAFGETKLLPTFGAIFLIGAVVLQSVSVWVADGISSPQSILSIHAVIVLVVVLLTNPTSAHALARAAHRSGVKPARSVVDDLEKEKRD